MSSEKPPRMIRNYEVREELGRGAFSVVYRVWSQKYQQTFAAKIITISADERRQKISQFETEIHALMSLQSPYIVKIYDFFRENDQCFMICDDCSGGSLHNELQKNGMIAPPKLYQIAKQMLEALSECHSLGISHRDIKPANILFDAYGRPKLADFGLAEEHKRNETVDRRQGSFAYKSPEIFGTTSFSPFKVDIWALGMTFFEMATGTLPWPEGSPSTIVKKAICQGELRLDNRMVNPDFLAMIKSMLNMDPRARPTCEALLALPILALPAPPPGPRRLSLTKNKSIVLSRGLLPSPTRPKGAFVKTTKDRPAPRRASDADHM